MNWQALIVFVVGIGIYFFGLGIFCLIKKVIAKKKYEEEEKARQEQSEVSNNEQDNR